MWGARGARLWRTSVPKLLHRQGAGAAKSSSQQQHHGASLLDSPLSLWSLVPCSESAADLASKDVCWRPAGSALLGLQQRMVERHLALETLVFALRVSSVYLDGSRHSS